MELNKPKTRRIYAFFVQTVPRRHKCTCHARENVDMTLAANLMWHWLVQIMFHWGAESDILVKRGTAASHLWHALMTQELQQCHDTSSSRTVIALMFSLQYVIGSSLSSYAWAWHGSKIAVCHNGRRMTYVLYIPLITLVPVVQKQNLLEAVYITLLADATTILIWPLWKSFFVVEV